MPQSQKVKAYSYIRFSTPDQMKGDSFRRQYTMAQTYAAKHGLWLDESLSLTDLGISAFRGQNAKTGALNFFLEHVRSGDVPAGSLLLIEALDRLSRQSPLDALDTLRAIMREGITVVTLDNERAYTTENINNDFTNLIVTLMLFSRANEESATKSRRLKTAWEGKRLTAATRPLTAICPGWMVLSADRQRYEVIPDRGEVIRSIFAMCLAGMGQHSIAARLNSSGTATFKGSEMWQRSYVKKILENPAVIGTYIPHKLDVVDGRKTRVPLEPLENYYPAVVSPEDFDKVAAMSSKRGLTLTGVAPSQTSGPANILAGLAKCPTCGATMTRVNKGRKGGKPHLVCTKAKAGAGCDYRQVKLEWIERAVLSLGTYLHDLTPSPDAEYEDKYQAAREQVELVEDEVQRLVSTLALGEPPKAVLSAIASREALLVKLRREEAELAQRAAALITNRIGNTVEEFCRATANETDPPDLARVNAILRQLFNDVVVDYKTGFLRMHWRHADDAEVKVFYTIV
ncbi:recombinase family protein [Rhizobium sp. B230/85]|uniref:recombinase family protein n=1 Tax=unclassified Rhizobium TaxID=2613769 RepID=UPI001ADD4A30|nr:MULTISPECIES: recombinase family protein [unclassified Rhizobium]MBO9134191.1 recombinase family protein [Rhizobium sp. B209b/85]QXZ96684.1 recombinase family protein [Rhizobium sp. B230/85]